MAVDCSPQRFLAGNLNAIRTAVLTPSSVLPIENSVQPIPTARNGSAQVKLTGPYSGALPVRYDVGIVDDDVETSRASAPVFTGEGAGGSLVDIESSLPAQGITVELSESGLPLLAAAVDFEGVPIKARAPGAAGNSIYFHVDQSAIAFTPQPYSLLNDLEAGAGGESAPMTGAEFDYDTKILGADGAIPADAHRISFGSDPYIYLQYKTYLDGKWEYFLVPELKRPVPKGTVVNFVTGGRTVTIYPGSPPETYPDIVTLYDLLIAIKTQSALVDVDGVVANDRTPKGQAAHELQTRTDAYFEPSSGEGSDSATGFEGVTVAAGAGTQLVVATCVAVSSTDHPLAGVGRTRWRLMSSTLGELGIVVEGIPFEGTEFGLTVPFRLPYAAGEQVGNFTVTDIAFVSRADGARPPPPICPGKGQIAGLLGPNAVNETITLTYTKRPTGECLCSDMPVANLATDCLGIIDEGGATEMAYSDEGKTRLKALYDAAAAIIGACTRYRSGLARDGIPDEGLGYTDGAPSGTGVISDTLTGAFTSGELSGALSNVPATARVYLTESEVKETGYADVAVPANFQECVDYYETGLAAIDALADGVLKDAGFAQWDLALQALVDDLPVGSPGLASFGNRLATIALGKYKILVRQAMAYAGIPQLGKTDASTVISGDGCWQDNKDPFYWTAVGSESGALAPLFNNVPYWASRRIDEKSPYFSMHSWAMHLRIKCTQDLLEGDQITLSINGAAQPSTYQVGDKLSEAIIGAHDLFMAGGQDSSLEQLWLVNGDVSGPLPSFSYNPDAPSPYSTGSPPVLSFTLSAGPIAYAKGDRWAFTIEGGHWRYRINGGAWLGGSPPEPIPNGVNAFDSGLSIEFVSGAAPSFVADDLYSFDVGQPYAVSNLQTPSVDRWRWNEANPTLVADLGSAQDLDVLAIALHTIPEDATITIEGGLAPGVYDWLETITWREELIAHALAQTRNARYLRLSLTAAAGGGIGWLWAGMAMATSKSADYTPRREYSFARGEGGVNRSASFLGKGRGAEVSWSLLLDPDMAKVRALLDWVKKNDDEWLVFLGQITRPGEAMLVQVVEDQIAEHDTHDGNKDADIERQFDVQLTLGAVLQ